VGGFKWKTIEMGTKTEHSSLGVPSKQVQRGARQRKVRFRVLFLLEVS
jgi:hypothetical protein